MQRREFITLLGGVSVAWPRTARAQQPARRVGVLMNGAPDDAEVQARLAAFLGAGPAFAQMTYQLFDEMNLIHKH